MPRPKSILQRVEVDEAQKAHNCQHNKSHRVERGHKRMKVWKDRSAEHYCAACGLNIIQRDMAELQDLVHKLQGTA